MLAMNNGKCCEINQRYPCPIPRKATDKHYSNRLDTRESIDKLEPCHPSHQFKLVKGATAVIIREIAGLEILLERRYPNITVLAERGYKIDGLNQPLPNFLTSTPNPDGQTIFSII